MPPPGPGGRQTSLAALASMFTAPFRRAQPQSSGAQQNQRPPTSATYSWGNTGTTGIARDITQFRDVFQPGAGMFPPANALFQRNYSPA